MESNSALSIFGVILGVIGTAGSIYSFVIHTQIEAFKNTAEQNRIAIERNIEEIKRLSTKVESSDRAGIGNFDDLSRKVGKQEEKIQLLHETLNNLLAQ